MKHDKHAKQVEQDAQEQQNIDEWPKERFWGKGFNILQNIQDRTNLEGQLKRARDQVTTHKECLEPDKTGGKRSMSDQNQLPDIFEFCSSTL